MKALILFSSLLLLFVLGCEEKKLEPVQVGAMSEYKDPAFGFRVQYPADWKNLGTTGKAVFARSQEVISNFQAPGTGEEGAQVTAAVIQYEGKSAEEIIQAAKDELGQVAQVQPDEQITVDGKPATKIPYAIQVTTKKSITGYEVYIPGDTAMYMLDFIGYGDQYTAHQGVFDAILASFQLPVIEIKGPDVWKPSPDMQALNTPFFGTQYPDNMNSVPAKKGTKDLMVELRADRQDCSIIFDVFGAQGLTVDKVWEQNKDKYKARGSGETTISGQKAFWVDYSLRSDIASRAYFMVNKDKVVRATLNWFAPQREIYFPVFENVVKSITLK